MASRTLPRGAIAGEGRSRVADFGISGEELLRRWARGIAGAGELVYWCRGKEASFPFLPLEVPTEATVVGIVDRVWVQRGA